MAIDVQFRADLTDAERSMVNFYALQEKVDQEFKQMSKSAAKVARETNRFGNTKGKVKGVKDEVSGFDKAANKATATVKNWIGGFVGIAGVVRLVQSLVQELDAARNIQKDMLGISIESQKSAYDIASLSGDVSQANIKQQEKATADFAIRNKIGVQEASNIRYFSKSSFEGEAAETTADSIAMAKTAYNLDNEAAAMLPSVFKTVGANTKEEQARFLNMVMQGASMAGSTPSNYIKPLGRMMGLQGMQGFSTEQTLGNYNAMIMQLGPESTQRASEEVIRGSLVTSGRNKKAMKFLSEEQKKQAKELEDLMSGEASAAGKDFASMTVPERQAFAIERYKKYEAEGNTDKMKELDSKGFLSLMMMSNPEFQAEAARVQAKTKAAADSGQVQQMQGQYLQTDIARYQESESRKYITSANLGGEYKDAVLLNNAVDTIFEQTQASGRGMLERVIPGMSTMIKYRLKRSLVEKSLQLAGEEEALKEAQMDPYLSPEDIQGYADLTGGFQNLKGADLRNIAPTPQAYGPAAQQYYTGISEETAKQLNGNLEQLNQNIEQQNLNATSPAVTD